MVGHPRNSFFLEGGGGSGTISRNHCHAHHICVSFSLSIPQALVKNLPASEMIASTSVAPAGFINIYLSDLWIAKV